KSREASPSNGFRSWRPPAPTTCRSARSRTRRRPSTSALSSSRSDLPADFAEALARVRGRLGDIAATVLFFPSTGSTNDVALRLDIKWPNDLYVLHRKLAGILAEGAGRHVALGYGINVGPMAYPPELADRATSIETELGRPADRAAVCAETIAAIARRYGDL